MPGLRGGAAGLVVLKFGGSVLTGREGLEAAVHEIYRWRRSGHRVLAVASAIAGRTDALVELGREVARGGEAGPHGRAALLGNGEAESAALLALHLDRSGVPAVLLAPAAFGLTGEGGPGDAVPCGLDPGRLRAALDDAGVVVVPGFVGVDGAGRTVLFGRGGSDTTALFLAHALGADRCRLVKDVPGLYERDPAVPGPPPRLYERASWDDALATDGSILQHKAVHLARLWNRPFEVAGPNGDRATRVGPEPSVLTEAPERTGPLPVVLLGLGTVGGGVASLLRSLPGTFRVVAAAARRPERHPGAAFPVTDDAVALARGEAPLVIEAMGGIEPALSAAWAALARGAHFVTANKSLLAAQGPELRALARAHGGSVRGSAAVAGSAPVLEAAARLAPRQPRRVRGILNGTTHFVLSEMARGVELEAALAVARERGYAERDAGRDLSGLDAAEKLCVIAEALGLDGPGPADVAREPLEAGAAARFGRGANGRSPGHTIAQVATLEVERGRVRARVTLEALDPSDPLARLEGAQNGAVFHLAGGGTVVVRGLGAGRWPTAQAVVADALDVAREGPGAGADGVPVGPIARAGRSSEAVSGDTGETALRGGTDASL